MLVRVWWRWPLVRRQQHPVSTRKVLVNRHRSLLRRRCLAARAARRRRAKAGGRGGACGRCWWSGRPSGGSRPASGRCWSFAGARTCPSGSRPAAADPGGHGQVDRQPGLARLRRNLAQGELHGPHDFRHTYATWLEDAGIPSRVIDELMGHAQSGRTRGERGSVVGRRYRHATPEMAARAVAAIEARLDVVLAVAARLLPSRTYRTAGRGSGRDGTG